MSTNVSDAGYDSAVSTGFMRLFDYISGERRGSCLPLCWCCWCWCCGIPGGEAGLGGRGRGGAGTSPLQHASTW